MTNFGPPGGGPPEPWSGRQPEQAYGPPADHRFEPQYEAQPGGWGEPAEQRYEPMVGNGWDDRGAGQPPRQPVASGYRPYQPASHGYPPAGQPGYPPADPYADNGYPPTDPYPGDGYPPAQPYADPTPPPKRGKGPLIAVLAVLAVLVLAGAATLYLVGRNEPAPVPGATGPSAVASGPAASASVTPAPASSADARFVKVGQCVRNDGPAGGKPRLVISECTAKTYQVLRRFDGATSGEKDAEAKCAKVEGYTNWYFFDSELDTLDFVLCLKQRR
ncbi:hypothetical protein GA0070624_0802 [Micromonospora rhizosphaerae]|uniref:Flagellar basal body-associated protein FliL n=1 Tax=Micromonospora rhizosphaerae TaxID=568872 RepID=A0A1C6REW8_9ACTN|nr:hypothetical protein GA0070624_0802 [Micromonospora rhizosphaerae]